MTTPELAHIRDIIPPAPITGESTELLYVLAVAASLILIGLYRYFRSSTSKLHRLRRQHRLGRKNNRQVAYQLRRLLCEQLGLVQFNPHTPPSEAMAEDWYRFAITLEASCFGRTDPEDELLNTMIDDAQNWLHKRS